MATAFKNIKNNAVSTLSGAITNVATSLTVQSGDGTKFPAAPFWATIEDSTGGTNVEIVLVTAKSTDTFTVTRGAQSTAAVAHAINSKVRQLWTEQNVTDIHTAINGIENGTTALSGLNVAGYITSPSGTAGFSGNPIAPNLVPNSSARFGTLYWTDNSSGGITAQQGTNGEGGFFWSTSNPGGNHYLESAFIPIVANQQITLSGDIFVNGSYTAGGSWIQVTYYTSGGAPISSNTISSNAVGWKRYSGTFFAPTNTAKVTVVIGLQSGTTGNSGTGWRRLKLEVSSVPTPYTFEADFWPQMFGTIIPNNLLMASGAIQFGSSNDTIGYGSGVFSFIKQNTDRYEFNGMGGAAGASNVAYGAWFDAPWITVSSVAILPKLSLWSNVGLTDTDPTTREFWLEATGATGASKVFSAGFANTPVTGRATAKLDYNGFWNLSNGVIAGGTVGWTPSIGESVFHTGAGWNIYLRLFSSKASIGAVNDANNAFVNMAFDAATYEFRQGGVTISGGPLVARGVFYSGGTATIAADADTYVYNNNNGALTLPASATVKSGKVLKIKNITDSPVTINLQSGDTVFTTAWQSSIILSPTEKIELTADGGTGWYGD